MRRGCSEPPTAEQQVDEAESRSESDVGVPDPPRRRQDESGGGDSRRGTHGRDALVFRQRQLRVSSPKSSAGGALGGCAREFPDAIGSAPAHHLFRVHLVFDLQGSSSTWTHRQCRAGEQEMVGPQSPGGLLPASPDGGVAKPNGEVPGEGVRGSRGADWCGRLESPDSQIRDSLALGSSRWWL
jgi:hypothetical protein